MFAIACNKVGLIPPWWGGWSRISFPLSKKKREVLPCLGIMHDTSLNSPFMLLLLIHWFHSTVCLFDFLLRRMMLILMNGHCLFCLFFINKTKHSVLHWYINYGWRYLMLVLLGAQIYSALHQIRHESYICHCIGSLVLCAYMTWLPTDCLWKSEYRIKDGAQIFWATKMKSYCTLRNEKRQDKNGVIDSFSLICENHAHRFLGSHFSLKR